MIPQPPWCAAAAEILSQLCERTGGVPPPFCRGRPGDRLAPAPGGGALHHPSAMDEAGVAPEHIDRIAVTNRPGLVGSLSSASLRPRRWPGRGTNRLSRSTILPPISTRRHLRRSSPIRSWGLPSPAATPCSPSCMPPLISRSSAPPSTMRRERSLTRSPSSSGSGIRAVR